MSGSSLRKHRGQNKPTHPAPQRYLPPPPGARNSDAQPGKYQQTFSLTVLSCLPV